MGNMEGKGDISWLFETQALAISPGDRPFWYTSGLIGPYFINTHFLCGGKQKALEILEFINSAQEDRRSFPGKICRMIEQVYETHSIYRQVIDAMALLAEETLPMGEVSYVSGGQRRDWFFAPMVARALGKQCLYLYNDLGITDEHGEPVKDLSSASVLNVADLLTVGSSYEKKWIPALSEVGASLKWSINAVDRQQGGEENLREAGVSKSVSLFAIALPLFDSAKEAGLFDEKQYQLVANYLKDPYESMRSFLVSHPEFLEASLKSTDEKTQSRAKLLVSENLYNLKGE